MEGWSFHHSIVSGSGFLCCFLLFQPSLWTISKECAPSRATRGLAGVDEAGRGPLAGPVIAAAVILPGAGISQRLFDSKKITQKKREALYKTILSEAIGVGMGVIGQDEIDLLNILQATLKAMSLAIGSLPTSPDFILIDGPHGLSLPIPQRPIKKGDQLSNSIAAASIVAKVTRDRIMLEYHEKYPPVSFRQT